MRSVSIARVEMAQRIPRHIHGHEVPVVQGKAMTRLGDTIDPSNHTRIVNPPRQGECRPGHVDLRKCTMVIEIAMLVEAADDHPRVIDSRRTITTETRERWVHRGIAPCPSPEEEGMKALGIPVIAHHLLMVVQSDR